MKVKEDYQFQGQITIFDVLNLDSWSGKMSQEHSVPEIPKEQISEQFLKKSSKSWSRKSPIFLCLKRDGPTQDALKEWEMMESPSALPGDCTMLNTGEFPNVERESHLSQILEVNPPPKYSLSAKACQGILNRANKRGKKLPEMLEKALINQVATQSRYEGGVEIDSLGHKAGKGALVQEELSGTLGVSQDQTLFQNVLDQDVYCIEGHQIDRETQCNGKGWREDKSYTLDTIDRHGVCHCAYDGSQIAPTLTANNADGSQRMPDKGNFNAVIGFDSYNLAETGDKGRCLATNSGGLNEHMPIVCGVDAFNQTETKDKTMPLTSAASDNHHIPCVYSVDEGAGKSSVCHYEDVSPTLATTHHGEPAVCYGLDRASFNQGKNAKYDFSVEEDKAQPIVARGPGGGNDVIGSLCARDSKGVGNQYVEEGKCIVQFHSGQFIEDK